MLHAIATTVLLLAWLAAQAPQAPSRAETDVVARAVQELADADAGVVDSARRELQAAPSDVAVEQIVEALNKNPAFKDQTVRAVAYALLRDHRAARSEKGYQQLLRGLKEPRAVPVLSALQAAPPEKQPEILDAIGQLLTEKERTDHELSKSLEILARSGALAQPVLARVKALYDDDARSELVRQYAAYAMIQIGGLTEALTHFNIVVPENHAAADLRAALIGMTMATHASAREGEDGIYQFFPTSPVETRQSLQSIAIGSLVHKDAQVRKAALEFLWSAFGTELVVEQTPGVTEVHPRVLAAVRIMAQSDPDADIRAEARRLVAGGGFQKLVSDFKRARESSVP